MTHSSIRQIFVLALAAVALLNSGAEFGFAQERGRLSDGRAFRTDAEGNQLVDYIAELEVSVEGLKSRVQGLESEVNEKQAAIDRLRAEGRSEAGIKEQTIGSDNRATQSHTAIQPASCAKEREQLEALSGELESARSDLEVERQITARKSKESEAALAGLQERLTKQEQLVATLSADLSEARAVADNSGTALTKAQEELASVRKASTPVLVVAKESDPRASLSVARLRAVEVVRGSVRTELNQLKGIVATRDQAFQRYKTTRHAVSFTPQHAASESGSTVAELEERLAHAESVAETSKIGREIEQIKARMNEDISLMRRMERARK